MGRIGGNLLTELFKSQTGEVNSSESGGIILSPNAALTARVGNSIDLMTENFVANDEILSSDGGAKETFWVKKSGKAEKISENLLVENFGFEQIDVAAYRALYGDLKIFDEKQCASDKTSGKTCGWATAAQIDKWRTSPDGKTVAVSLPEATVKFLRDFRQGRLIERSVMSVSDEQLRGHLENDLRAAVTKSGQERAAAFTDLRNVLEDDSTDGKNAAAVVKLMANLPENKENPFTQILLAKIELKEIYSSKEDVMFNPKMVEAIERRIDRAADLASGYDEAGKTRDPKKAVSRAESQALNDEAARLAEQFGKPSDARFRTILARFYAVDDAERGRYDAMRSPQMTTLPRQKNSPTVLMSATPKETPALERFQRENPSPNVQKELAEDPQKREWKTRARTDGKGGIETEAYQQFQREGSMKPEGVQSNTTYIYKDEKGNIVPEGRNYARKMPVTTRQITERGEINSAGTTRIFGMAGAVGAIEEVNKWTPFLVDLYRGTTAKKVAEFERLKRAEFDANNFPVPPKPERIQQMKRDLVRYPYGSQSEFQRIQWTMKRLEDLSYAFWNR